MSDRMNLSFAVVFGLGLLHYGATVAVGPKRPPARNYHSYGANHHASASDEAPVVLYAPPPVQQAYSSPGWSIPTAYSQAYSGDKQTLMARPVTFVPPQITFNPPQLVYGPPTVTSAAATTPQSNPSAVSSPGLKEAQSDSYYKILEPPAAATDTTYQKSPAAPHDAGPPGLDEVVTVLAKYFNATRAQVTKSLSSTKDDSTTTVQQQASSYPPPPSSTYVHLNYDTLPAPAPVDVPAVSAPPQYQSPPQPIYQVAMQEQQYQAPQSSPQTTYQASPPPQPTYQASPPQPTYQSPPPPQPTYQSPPPQPMYQAESSPQYPATQQQYSPPQSPKKPKKMVPMVMMMPMYDNPHDNDLDLDCEKRLSKKSKTN